MSLMSWRMFGCRIKGITKRLFLMFAEGFPHEFIQCSVDYTCSLLPRGVVFWQRHLAQPCLAQNQGTLWLWLVHGLICWPSCDHSMFDSGVQKRSMDKVWWINGNQVEIMFALYVVHALLLLLLLLLLVPQVFAMYVLGCFLPCPALIKCTTFDTVQSYFKFTFCFPMFLVLSSHWCHDFFMWPVGCVTPPPVIHHQPVRFGIPNGPSTIKRGHHQGKVFLGTLALQKKSTRWILKIIFLL